MMTNSVRRELTLPQPQHEVWRALTDSAVLAEWMYPNDFVPQVGHSFTFNVPANPKADFDGTVRGEVLRCAPPGELTYSWAGGPVVGTQVSYQLQPDGDGTRITFEHTGFDLSHPYGEQALRGAEAGWTIMLRKLTGVLSGSAAQA